MSMGSSLIIACGAAQLYIEAAGSNPVVSCELGRHCSPEKHACLLTMQKVQRSADAPRVQDIDSQVQVPGDSRCHAKAVPLACKMVKRQVQHAGNVVQEPQMKQRRCFGPCRRLLACGS
eukprot:TRINITY_DN111265_c0_g1_i1.p1 TRINITY_DN111265_c0_g1~~TRINITY_DN111265_c0_g1_i1.p1  ORF type:complete len:119 (-),score=14.73 TRINITY_DN111265_c0_g1_i1:156-512(-)